jgi:hypothetical protein
MWGSDEAIWCEISWRFDCFTLLGNLLIYSGSHSKLLCELSLFVPLEPGIVSAWMWLAL